MKKLYIETLGCAMNERDSEHIIAQLRSEGYESGSKLEEADLIIINTCSVREKPVSKLFSELGMFKKRKKDGAKIGVCGCTASHLGEDIIKRAPYVDFVIGAREVSKITEAIKKKHYIFTDITYDDSLYEFSDYRSNPYKAKINISIGCDKKCTFCIVPNTRGEEISIPPDLIVKEAKRAALGGAKEIFLLGQNVNNYGRRFSDESIKCDFTKLLRMVSEIDEVKRIRFTSPHPLHMDDEFIEEFVNNPKICKSMHMPLQSGSTKVLQRMKRGYSKEWFLQKAFKLRELLPNVSISTDIIVGFPGESDEDFEETIDVVKKVNFEQIFSFRYSPRPGTKALEFDDTIDESKALQRLHYLQKLQTDNIDDITNSKVGEIMEVYFDELRGGGVVIGRSDNNFLVQVEGSEELLGRFAKVAINRAQRTSLYGEVVDS